MEKGDKFECEAGGNSLDLNNNQYQLDLNLATKISQSIVNSVLDDIEILELQDGLSRMNFSNGIPINEDNDIGNESGCPTSKWETIEPSEEKLNRLDGLARKRSGKDDDKVDASASIESWLQSHLPEDYGSRQETDLAGQKRVRWADIEERRAQEHMRNIGFVVGHTDWNRMTDPTRGGGALTRTKYI